MDPSSEVSGPEQSDNKATTVTDAPRLESAIEPGMLSPSTPAVADKPWRWKPGESGNPKGRAPKGTPTLTGELRKQADKRKLAASLLSLAYKGDVAALRYVYDRIEGTPVQRHEDVSADTLKLEAGRIATALGVPVEEVLAQYAQLTGAKPPLPPAPAP